MSGRRSVFPVSAIVFALLTSGQTLAQNQTASSSVTARGLVRAVHEATLSSEMAAKIMLLPKKDGEAFRKGEVLVDFDCDRVKAEWRVAEAERIGALAAHDNSRRLAEYRAAGAHEVQIARAAFDKAAAAVEVIAVRLRQCRVIAPFDGRVVEVPVREHEMPQAGAPLLRVVDDSKLEIDMIVPAVNLKWLKPGAEFSFRPDDSAGSFRGDILRVGAAIDPVSQTIRVTGRLEIKSGDLLPGQAGVVSFGKGGA
jgi:membrane fusion protein, multidrug efflux system